MESYLAVVNVSVMGLEIYERVNHVYDIIAPEPRLLC
jgi:hypothetical protein